MPNDLPGSPMWWLTKLQRQLTERQPELATYDNYYEGHHRLGFATPKFKEAFGSLFSSFADNWCDLVVDAVEERLDVEGFRLGKDPSGDRRAWNIWQVNQLDADSQVAHTESLIFGESYALVWNGEDDRVPSITIEHPSETIVANVAGSRKRAAALKRWRDDDGYLLATLYLPDALYKFRSRTALKGSFISSSVQWMEREVSNEVWPLPNPLGVVPVVPLVNRPRLLKPGVSEIKKVIPVQDAVNKTIADMLVASEYTASPQRWATGIEIPTDPIAGQPLPVFEHMINRFWRSDSSDTKFGQFTQADLSNFVQVVEMFVQHIASQTRTPPHYFYLRGEFPSGESIKSAETGLVAKARRKMRHFGEAWEEVMRLSFLVIGDQRRANVKDSEVIWGDAESRSESEHTDALTKMKALNVPDEILWEKAGFTPTEIERMKTMREAEPPIPAPVSPSGAMPELPE